MSFVVILFLFLAAVFILKKLFFEKKVNLPPGPMAFPIVGNLPTLLFSSSKKHPATTTMIDMAKKYGPIFSMHFGPTMGQVICLDDPTLVREALNLQVLTGRPENKLFSLHVGGKHGILNSDGEEWQEQRRFTLRHLRDFGFGKQSMDSVILEEVKEILDWMKSEEGQPISISRRFGFAILNALWMIVTGHRFKHDDPTLTTIMDQWLKTQNELMENPFLLFMPGLAEKIPNISGWNRVVKAMEPIQALIKGAIKDHVDHPNPDENSPRDFIDVYLNEMKNTTDPASSFYGEAGRKSLFAVVSDLQQAGGETTSTTLAWVILLLATHPEVQTKLHREIDEVIGQNRLPSLADKIKMPYVEAFVSEVLRKSSLVPGGAFHTATTDFEFHGYTIPKDAHVLGNIYSMHHNPKYWDEPELFRPERFLSKDGKTFIKNDALMAFSTGKRVCLGEVLARAALFLFLIGIFQRFEVQLAPENPNPSLEPHIGVISAPYPFKVVMKERFES